MKKLKQFTLVEILVVIAIIGILAGLIFPALFAVQENSRRTKTETILTSVNIAVKSFKGDYYCLPTSSADVQTIDGWNGSNIDELSPDDDYYDFFDTLTYSNHQGGSKGVTDTVKSANVKAVHYLDVPKNYFDRDNGSVRDAWDRPIVVWLDHDGDGVITIPNGKYATQERTYMSDSVAISLGLQSADRLNDVDKVEFITVGQ